MGNYVVLECVARCSAWIAANEGCFPMPLSLLPGESWAGVAAYAAYSVLPNRWVLGSALPTTQSVVSASVLLCVYGGLVMV